MATACVVRSKGAFLVSASWNPAHGAHGVTIEATVDSPMVALASPFSHAVESVRLKCSGQPVVDRLIGVDEQGCLKWAMVAGQSCELLPQ